MVNTKPRSLSHGFRPLVSTTLTDYPVVPHPEDEDDPEIDDEPTCSSDDEEFLSDDA